MKRILLPLVAYLLCILPLSFHKPPRQIQILTSGIEFRTLTFGRTYVPEGARDGVCLTDTIHYLCPATGSDPFTLAALQTLLPREVFGYGGQVTPSSFARYAEGLHSAYVNEYENDAYGMRDSADAPPLYMNYSRYVTMRLDFSSPRAVVVNCSQNDLTAYGDEDILSNKTRLADKLKNMTDDLLFLSVIKAPCVESQSERIKRLDEAVGRICRRAGARFIDISGLFAADCFEDDAHLNAEGYRRLAAVLRGELRQYIRE